MAETSALFVIFIQEEIQKYISYSRFLIILHGKGLVYLNTPKS